MTKTKNITTDDLRLNGNTSPPIKILSPENAPKKATIETRGRPAIYPFDELEVGGCFEVPEGKLQSVRQSCSNKRSLGEDKQFSVAKAENGKWYCWRDK